MTYASLNAKLNALLTTYPHTLLAIDGNCASGKTTLAGELQRLYGCNVIPTDHFFLRLEQRTPDRLQEPGGNVDYERFAAEVLTPLRARETFTYRPFDCKTGGFGDAITVTPNRLNIIEGTYSLYPALADAYHIKVFLCVPPEEQIRRITARNGTEMLQRFETEWIPMSEQYFAAFDVAGQCDFVFA